MSEKERLLDVLGEGVTESFDDDLKRAFDVADNEVPKELRNPEKIRFYPDKLKISGDGIFYTLQGEGPTMGRPASFLRLHICNLKCVWCDAYYTWNPKSVEFWTEPQDWTIEETKEKVINSWGTNNPYIEKRLVITGGEPLIQQVNILKLISELPDWKFEIETNGTLAPVQELLDNPNVQFNCSPKLKNSLNSRTASIRVNSLNAIAGAKGGAVFKFVVMTPEELDEIENDFIKATDIDVNQVILMPQGVTPEEVNKNALKVANYAKEKGYRMLGRLQVEVWGAKRKV